MYHTLNTFLLAFGNTFKAAQLEFVPLGAYESDAEGNRMYKEMDNRRNHLFNYWEYRNLGNFFPLEYANSIIIKFIYL